MYDAASEAFQSYIYASSFVLIYWQIGGKRDATFQYLHNFVLNNFDH